MVPRYTREYTQIVLVLYRHQPCSGADLPAAFGPAGVGRRLVVVAAVVAIVDVEAVDVGWPKLWWSSAALGRPRPVRWVYQYEQRRIQEKESRK